MLSSTPIYQNKFMLSFYLTDVCMHVIEMNQSTDQTKENNHRRNVVNVNYERSSRNENTSRSSTLVSMQQMVTGQMTVGTMNNKYSSSKPVSMQQMVAGQMTVGTMNYNNYSSNRVIIQSYIDQRPVVVDTVVNKSMLIQSLISQ